MPFIALFFICLSQIAMASPYSKKTGRLSFDLESSFLKTSENLDASGDVVDLRLDGHYSEIRSQLNSEYDYSKYLTFTSGLALNAAKSSDGTFERTSTALTDLDLGFEYILYRKRFWIMPSFNLRIPLQTYETNTDEVVGNDPSYDLEALLNISTKWKSIYLHVYSGLTYRTEGLSMLIPYGFESMLRMRRWGFGAGLKGIFSITDDDDTSNKSERTTFLETVNAGSFKYYSINPNLTSFYAFTTYHISRSFYLGLAVDQTLFGENAYYGTTYTALFGLDFGNKKEKKLPKLKRRKFRPTKQKGFQYHFEGERDADEDVFNQKGRIRYQEKNVDEELDGIEDDIEIKLKRQKSR